MSRRPGPEPALLVLSPHLDDAVLSCAGLLSTLPPAVRVSVVTFFTQAQARPVTRAARSFLRQAGWPGDPEAFYRLRRREDRQAVGALGADWLHLGLVDALFRSRQGWVFGAGDGLIRAVRRVLPELTYRYPSYRYDIARGRVSRGDRGLRRHLTSRVALLLDELRPIAVLAPLGVGRHVDHLLVRDAAVAALAARGGDGPVPAFYAELPYALRQRPDPQFVTRHRLGRWEYRHGAQRRAALVGLYRTQSAALFPDGVPSVADEYWWPTGPDRDRVLALLGCPDDRGLTFDRSGRPGIALE